MEQDRQKLASSTRDILLASAQQLEKLAMAHKALQATAQRQEHELKAYKLAHRMEERGLEQGLSFEEKVAKILEIDFSKLATMEQAVEMAAGGFRLGAASEPVVSGGGASGDDLDQYILSQQALT